MEAVSAAVKASEDAGVKRKFSELFRRLDGVATIDGRGAIQSPFRFRDKLRELDISKFLTPDLCMRERFGEIS